MKEIIVISVFNNLLAPYYKVKYFLQRGLRGYSDWDICNLDEYLAGVLSKALIDFDVRRMSYPCSWNSKEQRRDWTPEECNICKCDEKWGRELRENAERFRLMEADDWYQLGDIWVEKEQENERLALEWLAKHFRALWW